MTNSVNYSDTDYENNCISPDESEDLQSWTETRQTMQSSLKFKYSWAQGEMEKRRERRRKWRRGPTNGSSRERRKGGLRLPIQCLSWLPPKYCIIDWILTKCLPDLPPPFTMKTPHSWLEFPQLRPLLSGHHVSLWPLEVWGDWE